MRATHIGTLDQGLDGSDSYYLIELAERDGEMAAPEQALNAVEDWFLRHCYVPCMGPGTRFCHSVLVSPVQHSDTKFIGIRQVRYDV